MVDYLHSVMWEYLVIFESDGPPLCSVIFASEVIVPETQWPPNPIQARGFLFMSSKFEEKIVKIIEGKILKK